MIFCCGWFAQEFSVMLGVAGLLEMDGGDSQGFCGWFGLVF